MSSPVRNLAIGRKTPLPGFRSSQRWAAANCKTELSVNQVKEYLARFPEILREYLLESATVEFLESILAVKKTSPSETGIVPMPRNKEPSIKISTLYSEIGINELCKGIMKCTTDIEISEKIYNITRVIASIVAADAFNLYAIEDTEIDLSIFVPNSKTKLKHVGPVGHRMTVSAYVAAEKKAVNAFDIPQDSRFPKGIGLGDETAHHVMCLPILLECGSVYGVVEFVRGWRRDGFSHNDFELTNAILSWVTACVQKMKLNKVLQIQTSLNNYLLDTTKVMFDDMENIDNLVTKIMMFTKDLVSADRCALFLVDDERHELFADYFDEGNKTTDGVPVFTKRSQIRFKQDRGIAGYVAKTGEHVNIVDAYKDDRFNPEIDKKTGYHTRNILCMPIVSKTGILGVVQMINRLNGDHFTQEDSTTFEMFAVYCALALHYSRIYNLLTHQQTKYKVAMEVLQFHIMCNDEDGKKLLENPNIPDDKVPARFSKYDFCCYDYDATLPQLLIKMVQDTFPPNTFEMKKLCNFVLTVRKNYRPVVYHNFQHGFHVAHSLWRMLKTIKTREFTDIEKMGLLIAGICHDLDHRGYGNDFFQKMKLPLAALYSTSTMEQHHYKQTITILHADGGDIFSFLTADQHKDVLEIIRRSIMATDLATYFPNQKYLSTLVEEDTFCMNEPEHREGLISLMMTAADLCAVPKPWSTQKRTVDNIYEEFYIQGDEEKKVGIQPIPMMDRKNRDEIPKQQVGFINFICIPLYTTLVRLLPETKPLLDGTKLCKENWEMVVTENDNKRVTLFKK